MQFNMFKIQFKDYLHSLFHRPSLKSIFDPNLYLHVHSFHLYQRIRQFEFKKLICSHARGFKLRWLKKLKEIAIWKDSLNPV